MDVTMEQESILGDGPRLMPDGLSGSTWHLARCAVLEFGAVWLTWTRSD